MKSKKRLFTTISIIIVIMMFLIRLSYNIYSEKIGGYADSGYNEGGVYYILADTGYIETTLINWYIGRVLYFTDKTLSYLIILAGSYLIFRIFIYNFFSDV